MQALTWAPWRKKNGSGMMDARRPGADGRGGKGDMDIFQTVFLLARFISFFLFFFFGDKVRDASKMRFGFPFGPL